jgi:hypothetical protein
MVDKELCKIKMTAEGCQTEWTPHTLALKSWIGAMLDEKPCDI